MTGVDVVIVGAGIAGASLAAEIAPHRSVVMLEAEDQPGYHSTGRSAAFWDETYGGPAIQPLTSASGPWLAEHGFLADRGALYLAREDQRAALDRFVAAFAGQVRIDRLERAAIARLVPGLRAASVAGAWIAGCADIDVAALHAYYLKTARQAGATLLPGARLASAWRDGGYWRIEAGGEALLAKILVNAAGAWADQVAMAAGAKPIGIQPYRRTIVQLAVDPAPAADLPLVLGIGGDYYFKPDAGGRLWLSPHDETRDQAGDVAADELDVAIAIDRLQSVVDWRVGRAENRWAGLRSFAPDRLPVYGFDPVVEGFFWCAGQGGFGIQTAPAAAKMAAALLMGSDRGPIDPKPYLASRFGVSGAR